MEFVQTMVCCLKNHKIKYRTCIPTKPPIESIFTLCPVLAAPRSMELCTPTETAGPARRCRSAACSGPAGGYSRPSFT